MNQTHIFAWLNDPTNVELVVVHLNTFGIVSTIRELREHFDCEGYLKEPPGKPRREPFAPDVPEAQEATPRPPLSLKMAKWLVDGLRYNTNGVNYEHRLVNP